MRAILESMPRSRHCVVLAALGCLAGLAAWPATPQARFSTVLFLVVVPVTLWIGASGTLAFYRWAIKSYNRRWLQFNLRGLANFVVLFSLALALWRHGGFYHALEQRRFIAAVEDLGGIGRVDSESKVGISLVHVTDEELAYLASMPGKRNVARIRLGDSGITDQGVVYLVQFPSLESIVLRHCPLTDEGLATLKSVKTLRRLTLEGCSNITDDGVDWLCTSKQLRMVNLVNTQVTSKKLAELRRALPYCDIPENIP